MTRASKQERRDTYAEKIESKRERFADRAIKAREESNSAHKRALAIGSMIPMGQPILVGHHSEKRHRRDLARIDSGMRKAIDLDSKAKHYADRAENYCNGSAISSDNPDAIDLLRVKLAGLEAEREGYKTANKALGVAYRKAKKANGGADVYGADAWGEIIKGLDLPDDWKIALSKNMRFACEQTLRYVSVKFTYHLTNLGANIRTVQKRIKVLEAEEKLAETPAEVIEGEGFTVEECPDDNRIRFFFDGKPEASVRATMKQNGFRWSPNAGAWQRQLNANGRAAAKYVAGKLGSSEGVKKMTERDPRC